MKILLCFVPLAVLFDHLPQVPAGFRFLASALGIVPLAAAIVAATERIALCTSPVVGGLFNATFGNAPELLISLMALHEGLIDVVKASLIGVILKQPIIRSRTGFPTRRVAP